MTIILEGMLIGALVSLPIGPLGIICAQKTINMGFKAGFLAGLGAALSDMVFSSTAVFGVSFINDFINSHVHLINGITGILFLAVGLNIFINPVDNDSFYKESKRDTFHPTLSTFLFGISNPLTFLIFLTIFAEIGLDVNTVDFTTNLTFVLSIFIGATIFWLLAAYLINHSKKKMKIETFYLLNRIIGISLVLFGVFNILKGILKF